MGPEVLLRVLQGLTDDEFKVFLWRLKMPDVLCGYQPINECQLEKAQRWDTVDLMVKAYTPDGALKVTKNILGKMNRNDLVQTLPGTSSGPAVNSTEVQMRDEAPAATTSRNLQAPHPRQEAPTLEEQIITAVAESSERKGLSRPELRKVLAAKGVDVAKSNKDINRVTLNLVRDGTLTQNNGIFKLAKEPKTAKKGPTTVKKPAAAAKAAANEAAVAGKAAAKKRAAADKAAEKAAAVKKSATEKAEAAKEAEAAAKIAAKKAAVTEKAAAAKRKAAKEEAEKAAAADEDAAMKEADAKKAAKAARLAIVAKEAAANEAEAAKRAAATKKADAAEKVLATKKAAAKKAEAVAEKAAIAAGRRLSDFFTLEN
ncbi:histone H1-like [Pempheris klunzingeri]|uniref:histone H1-like n=1 Tax=Pempheris klunzingeri TaxID=3127111 RepID=UPI00397F23CC